MTIPVNATLGSVTVSQFPASREPQGVSFTFSMRTETGTVLPLTVPRHIPETRLPWRLRRLCHYGLVSRPWKPASTSTGFRAHGHRLRDSRVPGWQHHGTRSHCLKTFPSIDRSELTSRPAPAGGNSSSQQTVPSLPTLPLVCNSCCLIRLSP